MSLVISPHFSPKDQQEFKERTSLSRLSVNELSRILEVPLSLLETEQQPNEANDHNEQQPRYWMPTCNNTDLIPSQFEDGTVTHSFANRKRSVVKRRKSVLSHSFTAESEAEAIRIEREAALAALENRLKKEHRESMGEIDEKRLRRSLSLTLPTNTEFGIPDIQNSPILIFGRGPALRRGAKSKFQRRSSCDTPSEIANYLSNAVENQELPPSPTESTASVSTCTSSSSSCLTPPTPPTPPTFTMQVSDYSSDAATVHHHILPEQQDFKALAPEAAEQADQPFPIESSQKKSKLPWSKRLFSKTKKQKSSSVMVLSNNNDGNDDDKMDDAITMDQVRQNHSKFNLSSLFSRKQNLNALKKNKSAVNLSTPAKDASPFTSTDTLMSTYYNKSTTDTSKQTAETNNFNNNRLPIHKERAIYKLSHLKLTHSRRPLRDQVMISNLMFWYLSMINQSNNNSLFCENASLARKTYGIPIAGANRRGTRRKNNNQMRNHQNKNPAKIPPRVGSKSHSKARQNQRTRYTSLGSDESDDSDEDEEDDSSSDEEEEEEEENEAEKVHKTNNKYRNHANISNHNTRLQYHHHQHNQHNQKPYRSANLNQDSSEEEDDMPLAMYKPKCPVA